MSAPHSEKRRFPRYPIDVRVSVVSMRRGALARSNVRSIEIGEAGLSITSPLEFPIGENVDIEFTLPESRVMMRVKSVIRNRNGFRYGIEFLSLSEAQRLDIRAIGEKNLRAAQASAPAGSASAEASN